MDLTPLIHWERLRHSRALPLLLCALAAWIVSLPRWDADMKALLPFAFLIVIFALGALWGREAGMLASIVAAAVFAYALYSPLHGFEVEDPAARASLGWMLLAGIALSFLLLPPGGSTHHPHPR